MEQIPIDGKSKTELENVVQQPPAQNIEDLDTIDERAARVEKRAIEPKQLINQYLEKHVSQGPHRPHAERGRCQ